ncbi:MAG: type II CAAX endopeptidase family protein [Aerococcus sp.]|nr:type II CAAX endopeptidase family protein [Aerococcus sp.]
MQTTKWIKDNYPKQSQWLKVILLLLLFIVVDFVIQNGAAAYAIGHLGITGSDQLLITLNAYPLYFLIPTVLWTVLFIVILQRAGLKLFGGFRFSRHQVAQWLIGMLFITIAQIGMSNLTAWLYPEQIQPANEQILESAMPQMAVWKNILVFSIYAPVREEVLMRGLIMRYLFPKWPYVGMIVSALVFASLHVTTLWIHFLTYFLMGFVFSWTYYRTGRIEYPIGLHALNNFLSTMLMRI